MLGLRQPGRNGQTVTLSEPDKFDHFLEKKEVTILVTDSGLGGISMFAEIARELRKRHLFEKVYLVYFNAWPEQNRGYNRLKNTAERIHVFDNALQGMMRFKPDFIMIACNTLSVLYHHTEFSRSVDIPVVDIVGFGVDMMAECLQTSTNDQAVILGTVTTIESHVHRDHLVQRGIQPEQIISQACDQLAFIEYICQPGIIIYIQSNDIFLVGNIIKGAPDNVIGVRINGPDKIIPGVDKGDFR